MPYDYFSSKEHLAIRIDKAWLEYINSKNNEYDRFKALDFLIYAFDIHDVSHEVNELNRILVKLMEKRADKKDTNPYYIPAVKSGSYEFERHKTPPLATKKTKSSEDSNVQDDLERGTLLDVNDEDKAYDLALQTTFLSPEERAEFNVEIFNGKFYKLGGIYDTTENEAHHKIGYVAFTLNANGELSTFSHLSGRRDSQGRMLVHSSMNSGSPVLAAGEMEIKNGKLISLNTYSGHYQPSLYSVSRFLEYLSERGVDISETKVYIQSPPQKDSGITAKEVYFEGDPQPWFEVQATNIMRSTRSIMEKNIRSIDQYLSSTKTRFFFSVLNLEATRAKVELAKSFKSEMIQIMDQMKKASSPDDLKLSLNTLSKLIDTYSKSHGKINAASGRLGKELQEMKKGLDSAIEEAEKVEQSYKNSF